MGPASHQRPGVYGGGRTAQYRTADRGSRWGGRDDPLFLRQHALAQTESIDAPDPRVLVFRTAEPNATYLTGAHAGPWSFFQAPEAWQIFGDRLRDDPLQAAYYTGTGPFQISLASQQGFVPENRVRLVRNPAYFRDKLPYFQEIDLVHMVDPEQQEAAYREGAIDAWTPGDPARVDAVLQDLSDQQVQQRPLAFGIQMAFSFRSNPDNPLQDVRIAQALHLALDRRLIQEHTYGSFARLSGPVPWFAEGWALSDTALAALPGYTPELSPETQRTIRGLIAASGYDGPLLLTLPDVFEATYAGIGTVLRESLRDRIGIDLTVSLASYTRIVEGLRDGSVGVTVGWGEATTDPDPTADLLETVHSAGLRNLGGFNDANVDAALERLRRTLNRNERRAELQRTLIPALNAAPSWQVNIAHGIQRTVFPPGVHLPAFGFGWDGHHYEDAWRDA